MKQLSLLERISRLEKKLVEESGNPYGNATLQQLKDFEKYSGGKFNSESEYKREFNKWFKTKPKKKGVKESGTVVKTFYFRGYKIEVRQEDRDNYLNVYRKSGGDSQQPTYWKHKDVLAWDKPGAIPEAVKEKALSIYKEYCMEDSFGESSEGEEEYEEEELEAINLEVSTRYAQKAQDAFRDVKFELKAKGRIDIDQRGSDTWEISFSQDWEREEVIDELEDIFERYGIKEYEFS